MIVVTNDVISLREKELELNNRISACIPFNSFISFHFEKQIFYFLAL